MKLTTGRWGGKNKPGKDIVWKSREKRISCISVVSSVAGTTNNSQAGMKARLLATSKSGFSILVGWRGACQRVAVEMERCARTVRVTVIANQRCGAEGRFPRAACTSACAVREPEHVEERMKQLVWED